MSADRFTIDTDDGIFIQHPFAANMTVPQMFEGAIRQQARDLELLTNMLHDQRLVIDDLEHRRVKVCDENDQLRTDLAAAVAENAALLAANRDLQMHFDAINGDYDEAAHFARHFIRDDPNITPRGAIIRLGDKCTDMFCRLQQAEARLAAIEAAPTVAVVLESNRDFFEPHRYLNHSYEKLPPIGTQLIARPAKD